MTRPDVSRRSVLLTLVLLAVLTALVSTVLTGLTALTQPAKAHVSLCDVHADRPAGITSTRYYGEGRVQCPRSAHNTGVVIQSEILRARPGRDTLVARGPVVKGLGAGYTTEAGVIFVCDSKDDAGWYYTRTVYFATGVNGRAVTHADTSPVRSACWALQRQARRR